MRIGGKIYSDESNNNQFGVDDQGRDVSGEDRACLQAQILALIVAHELFFIIITILCLDDTTTNSRALTIGLYVYVYIY